MKLNTIQNPKFQRLQQMISQDVPRTVGYLEIFWHFAYLHAPAGNVGKWSDAEIEAACHWTGESGELVGALAACGFVDRCSKNRLVIHDWDSHAPEFIQKRVKRKSMEFAEVDQPEEPSSSGHVAMSSGQVPPPANRQPDMSNREEKPSHSIREPGNEKNFPVKNHVSPARTNSSPSRRRPATVCPESLDLFAVERIVEWAASRPAGAIDRPRLRFGWDRFRDWARSKDERKSDWESAFRNALAAGWPLEGFERDPSRSPEQARAERTKQAARDAIASGGTQGGVERFVSDRFALLDGGR